MISTAERPFVPDQRPAFAATIKPLVAVVMLIATILAVLFDSAAFVTVLRGPVLYPGLDIAEHGGQAVVAAVSDPKLVHAGVQPGQPVVWQGRSAWRAAWPQPGDVVDVQTGSKQIAVRAVRVPMRAPDSIFGCIAVLMCLIVAIFAGVLCFRRPGVMTIAFWVFAISNLNIAWLMNFYGQLPEPLGHPLVIAIEAIAGGWGYYPLVWFALRFPNDRISDSSMRVADKIWTFVSIVAIVWFFVDIQRVTFGNSGFSSLQPDNFFWRYTVPQNLPALLAVAAFLWAYVRTAQVERQRVLWAIVALAVMLVLLILGDYLAEVAGMETAGNFLFMLVAFCPFALIYAVFRHHLLDISFVVNRAIVYSVLTAVIVMIVGSVDWLATKYLFESRAAMAVEAVVTIGLGLALQRLHRALERAVDRIIFARRYAAERHIDHVIAGLSYVRTHRSIFEAIVEEPRTALNLSGASFFLSDGDSFTMRSNRGWHLAADAAIGRDDSLVRLLLAARRVLSVQEAHWHSGVSGLGPESVDIAVPLFSRNNLLGVALYGRHENGSSIDPEERRVLQKLCNAAAVAIEAVELAEAREQIAEMQARLFPARS